MGRLLAVLLSLALPESFGFETSEQLNRKVDSIFNLPTEQQMTFVEIISSEGPPLYFSATFKTLHHPESAVVNILSDMQNFSRISKFVKRSQPTDPSDTCTTFFIEAAVMLSRSWFVGDLQPIETDGYGRKLARFTKNKDSTLNALWRKKRGGWWIVEYNKFTIMGMAKDLGNGKTRTAIIAHVAPNMWIPKWLFKIVSKKVFPGFLRDFEKALDIRTN